MTDGLGDLPAQLEAHGQAHLLAFAERLPAPQLASLLDQIDEIDFEELDELVERFVRTVEPETIPDSLAPAPVVGSEFAASPAADRVRERGGQLIAAGRIAAFTVAGGQGTRLGWNGPKGTYPATPVTGRPLFRVLAEQILAAQERWKTTIPW